MKTKYLLIYILVGIAFLAVSAWVFFTRGKNAKAIKAKYRLGGLLITCMTMLSAASCGQIGGPGQIMCYEPVVEERTDNFVSLNIKSSHTSYRYNELSPGDVFSVNIRVPSYRKYVLKVILNNRAGTELQRAELVVTDPDNATFDIPLSKSVTHRGEAIVQVQGVVKENPEELSQMAYGVMVINIR